MTFCVCGTLNLLLYISLLRIWSLFISSSIPMLSLPMQQLKQIMDSYILMPVAQC